MLLAIEQGNTNTLFAVHDGTAWIAQWRAATESTRTADEYAVWLSQLLAMSSLSLGQLDACIISSVVPQSLFNLRNLSRRYLHVEPLVIGENADLGIEMRILKPSEAGADRLVNAIGAHAAYPGDLLVIDSGTATTFDVVAGDGAFEGGVIAPGINLSMQALHDAAAQLPRVAIRRPAGNRVVGVDTVGAMQSGVFWGYIAMIEGLVARIKAEWDRTADRDRHRRRRLAVRRRHHAPSITSTTTSPFAACSKSTTATPIWRADDRFPRRRARVPAAWRVERDRHELQSLRLRPAARPQVDRGRSRRDLRRPDDAGRRDHPAGPVVHRGARERHPRHRADPRPRGPHRRGRRGSGRG